MFTIYFEPGFVILGDLPKVTKANRKEEKSKKKKKIKLNIHIVTHF